MTRILVLPGDVRYNLGDLAILLGILEMVRSIAPDARVSVWGKRPHLSDDTEGVQFYSRPSLAFLREARRCDLVLWGGGQLLQGNRSRVKLAYWAARIGLLLLLGRRIVGVSQGVGPLPDEFGRRIAAILVRRTDRFVVRDPDSAALLEESGVPSPKLLVAADPALLWATSGAPLDRPERDDGDRPSIGLSLRWTAHHRAGRIVPFQLLPEAARRDAIDTPAFRRFQSGMIALADRIVEELDVDLHLIPMYSAPWETDEALSEAVAAGVQRRDRVRVFRPESSLRELAETLRGLDAFIGIPMHSTILATSQGVPTLAVPYEPKGVEYMNRLGQGAQVFPLADAVLEGNEAELFGRVESLWKDRGRVRREICRSIPKMRKQARLATDPVRTALDADRPTPRKGREPSCHSTT